MRKKYFLILLCILHFLPFFISFAQSVQKYENFKTKLLETLNSSRTTVQLEQTELTGFTRQQTLAYFEEVLRKESDPQLIEVALAYYRYVPESSARTLLSELSSHPQFGIRALSALIENHPESAYTFLETLLKNSKWIEYPFREEVYTLLGKRNNAEAEKLLLEMLPLESLYQETLLNILGGKPEHLSRLFPFLSIYPVPVLKAILAFGRPTDQEKAIPFLQHPQIAVKLLALQIVVRLRGESSVSLLMQQLQDPSWVLRREAIRLLRINKFPMLYDQLFAHFTKDIPNQGLLLELLLSLPEGKKLSNVKSLLAITNSRLIKKALVELGKQPLAPAEVWLDFLLELLGRYSKNSEVILSLLPLLKSLPLAECLERHPEQQLLFKQLLQNSSVFVQAELLDLLGVTKGMSLRAEVILFLNHPSVLLKRTAISVLGIWESLENLPLLLERIQEESLSEELRAEFSLAIFRIQKKR